MTYVPTIKVPSGKGPRTKRQRAQRIRTAEHQARFEAGPEEEEERDSELGPPPWSHR